MILHNIASIWQQSARFAGVIMDKRHDGRLSGRILGHHQSKPFYF